MSPLPNTVRRNCEHCRRTMNPRKGESKYGYQRRRFCNGHCESAWQRRNQGDVGGAVARIIWEGMKP